jgi:hypothetical protein
MNGKVTGASGAPAPSSLDTRFTTDHESKLSDHESKLLSLPIVIAEAVASATQSFETRLLTLESELTALKSAAVKHD